MLDDILKYQKEKGYTQQEMANKLGISREGYNKIINKKVTVSRTVQLVFNELAKSEQTSQQDIFTPPKEMTEADRAMIIVTHRELAKLMSKVYGKPLKGILNELEQNTTIELNELLKQK